MKSIVDNIWRCGCGSMNSPFLEKCGGCGKEKPKNKTDK
jgi:hypothetical protein